MLMKAIDTLHVSAVGPDNIQPGQTFEINDGDDSFDRLTIGVGPLAPAEG